MSAFIKKILSSLSAVALTACSPVNLLNAVVPSEGYQLVEDVAYGQGPRHKLDIYQPTVHAAGSPTIVFFYGGGWEDGDKKDYKFLAQALTSRGYTVVVPDYRVYPEVVFPAFVNDAASAVAWTEANISEYGGDTEHLFLMGHSAGAHIAALLNLNADYLAQHGVSPEMLSGVIGLAGPYDFLPLKSDTLKTIFGPEETRWQSQPIEFVTGQHPPMLLMVGLDDLTVWPRNSIRLAQKLEAQGSNVQLVQLEGYGHVAMVAKLARPLRGDGALLKPIVEFINQKSQP